MERKKMLRKVPLNPGITKGSRKQKRKDFRVMLEERGDHEYCKLCNETFPNSEIEQHFKTKGHKVAQRKLALLRFDWKHQNGKLSKIKVPPEPIYSVSSIQGTLDNYKGRPLIGLEYLLEFTEFGNKPFYLCLLCYKRGFLEDLFPKHLASDLHTKKYLQFHFPTVYQKIQSLPQWAGKKKNIGHCLVNIASAIERSFGRLEPIQVEAWKFRYHIMHYVDIIRKGYHFDESNGRTFEDLVDRDRLIEEAKLHGNKNQGKDDESDNSEESDDQSPNPEKEAKLEKFNELSKFIDEQMRQEFTKFMEDPEKHPKYNEEWNKFWSRRYTELKAERKDPSTYDFKPEWGEFWEERFMELHWDEIETKKKALRTKLGLDDDKALLIDDDCDSSESEGEGLGSRSPKSSSTKDPASGSKDCSSHPRDLPGRKESSIPGKNSNLRCENLKQSPSSHKDSSSHLKDSPFRPKNFLSNRKGSPSKDRSTLRSRSPKFSSNSKDCPSHLRDLPGRKESTFRGKDSNPRSENLKQYPSSHKDSPSHLKDSPFRRKDSPPNRRGSPSKDRYTVEDESRRGTKRSWSREKSSEISLKRRSERNVDFIDEHWDKSNRSKEGTLRKQDPKYPVDIEAESVNIFAVLRLLTAVEERLGSLGPKVVDLMSQALVLENKKANSSEELLNNDVNCVLLETAKEKLKGQLQAGLVDSVQQKVFANIIRNVEILIRGASRRKKPREEDSQMMILPGFGFVDREKVSRQIVESLISQGKKDVTLEELEQLLKVFARKEQTKPPASMSFVEKTIEPRWSSKKSHPNPVRNVKDTRTFQQNSESKREINEVSQKYSGNKEMLVAERKMKDKNETQSFVMSLMGSVGRGVSSFPNSTVTTSGIRNTNRNYNTHGKINIISGVPVSSITINEFGSRNKLEEDYDMTRENWMGHQRTNVTGQNLPPKNFPITSGPDTRNPYNTTGTYQEINTTYDKFTSSRNVDKPGFGVSNWRLFNKPLDFPTGNNTPANFHNSPLYPDRNIPFSNVPGSNYKSCPSMLSSNRNPLKDGDPSIPNMPGRNSFEGWGEQRYFEPTMRGNSGGMDEVGGRMDDPRSEQSYDRFERYSTRERVTAFEGGIYSAGSTDISNFGRSQVDHKKKFDNYRNGAWGGCDKTKYSRKK